MCTKKLGIRTPPIQKIQLLNILTRSAFFTLVFRGFHRWKNGLTARHILVSWRTNHLHNKVLPGPMKRPNSLMNMLISSGNARDAAR